MADTGIYIKVIRKETIREDSSLIKLKITNKSSEVRKILAYDDIIRMNDAFTINRINPVKPIETIHDGTVEFNSKDTWEKKINMFLNAEAGLVNFGSLRLMNTKNKISKVAARRQFTRYLGGRSQEDLFNFDDELWIESLSNYKCWKCIDFHESIHIFQLLDHNLRKEVYKVIGKKFFIVILYLSVVN
uniref:Uncharacterized protein n=1 Tax=Rhizophagus irregularis (strain DAOM 181602 / DAOM 197198 / MUCL 43194) TaxID=747089 RepID=U9UPA8_RHIID